MARIGYIRVSTMGQNTERQKEELKKYNCDKFIYDKSTGKHVAENFETMAKELVKGDELIVLSLDRLGRSLKNNLSVIEDLKEKGIKFRSIKENLIIDSDNDNPMNDFILSIFSSVAQLERSMINERITQGIDARKKRLGKAYNNQAIHRTKRLKNKTFRNDIEHKNRLYVMDKWSISKATYFNYKRLIIKK